MSRENKRESVKKLIRLYDTSTRELLTDIKNSGLGEHQILFCNKYMLDVRPSYLDLVHSEKIKTFSELSDFVIKTQGEMIKAMKSKDDELNNAKYLL